MWLMDTLAVLLTLTLIAFFVVNALIIANALAFLKTAKRIQAMVQPTQKIVQETVQFGQGVGEREVARFERVKGHSLRAYGAVMTAKDEITVAAKSVDVDEAKATAEQVKVTFAQMQAWLQVAQQVIALVNQINNQGQNAQGKNVQGKNARKK